MSDEPESKLQEAKEQQRVSHDSAGLADGTKLAIAHAAVNLC